MRKKEKATAMVVSAEAQVQRLYHNPIQEGLVGLLDKSSDQELTEYGEAILGVLSVLVRWAKRAAIGLAEPEDLRKLFCTSETPPRVRVLIERIIGLVTNG